MDDDEKQDKLVKFNYLINWLEEHVARQEGFKTLSEKETAFEQDSNAANMKINTAIENMDDDGAKLHESLVYLISELESNASFLETGSIETATIIKAASTQTDSDGELANRFGELAEPSEEQARTQENTLDHLDQVIELSGLKTNDPENTGILSQEDKDLIIAVSNEIAELKSGLDNFAKPGIE